MVNLDYIKLNIDYVKTAKGILKILQIVLLLIAFSCITDCCNGGKPFVVDHQQNTYEYTHIWYYAFRNAYPQQTLDEGLFTSYPRNVSFFLAVTIFGWMLVLFYFILFFLKLNEKFSQIKWEMMVMITSIAWSVLLLLCCSLMGSTANTANKGKQKIDVIVAGRSIRSPVADVLEKWVTTMNTGVVFGFFSMIAFLVDAILLFKEFWTKRKTNENMSADGPSVTKVFGGQESSKQHEPQQQHPPGRTLQAPSGHIVPNLPGQTVPNSSGQAVQMWQMA